MPGESAAGPRVTEVVAVEDLVGGAEATQFTVTELFRRAGTDGPLAWTGEMPERAARALADAGHDVRGLLADAPPAVGDVGERDGGGPR